ncbi:MAG TPA: carboxypeptidase regulatory-like domain-containing protein [Pyrinomonadaceae bacterium]|nr:carboxypeptidase regulatory-like domain-containing protein [Pyrinomonadaceae bacterium]
MKRTFVALVVVVVAIGIALGFYFSPDVRAGIEKLFRGDEPDIPVFAKHKVDKEEFMLRRAQQLSMYRGIHEGVPFDPQDRFDAIAQMERQQEALQRTSAPMAAWTELGPNPIPNAQVGTGPATAASGRVLAIAVHPTNADIVYVGTAQGGLYRSTNGGATWTPLLDNALSLAVNAVAIAPSNPEIVYVGTGESGFCGDCFFGAGMYRIDNASTTADLSPAFGATTTFAGRSISKIVVHPTDPATIFVTSSSGSGGIGGQPNSVLAQRGVFRSTDATSGAPTFTKLTVAGLAAQDRAFGDMVIDPGDPNRLLVAEVDTFALAEGGVYLSTNALSGSPTFARTFATTGTGSNASRTELALHRSAGGVVTVYAASAQGTGTVQRSIDGGATWTQMIDNNFCNPQCFYDIAVDVDPTNVNNVYIGGSPTLVFGRSTNGGTTFTANGASFTSGLHVDSHAIAVAPSNPLIVYFGSDGGIYRTNDVSGATITWTSLNNSTFRATQFMSLDVHPTDPNITIGGTQDNGTNRFTSAATWTRTDFGDGGYSVIDQSSSNTTTFNQYHTYFNNSGLTGYAFSNSSTAFENWTFRGCQGATANGITCTALVNFYAPLERGPGTPNTVYYGADRLYRSADTGLNHTTVSQIFTSQISAIGISDQDDNVRIIGQNNGGIFGTGTTPGTTTLQDRDPGNVIPNNYVGRAVIDPQNVNTAYVTLAAFGVTNVWKTTNLNVASPTWTAANTGLPAVPVNAFVVDPLETTRLYAGTDIGVYTSGNGGATWTPFGTGLPRVAVFDIAIAPGSPRQVRIATHGRGLWQTPVAPPTAANVSISGRVLTAEGRGLRNAVITITDQSGNARNVMTGPMGTYRFDDLATGATYIISVRSRRFSYEPRVVALTDELTGYDITPMGTGRGGSMNILQPTKPLGRK